MNDSTMSRASTAKRRFLEADAAYEQSESLVEVLKYLDRYLDPDEKRAPGLKSFVRRLKSSIKHFSEEVTSLMLAIALVHSALQQRAGEIVFRPVDISEHELDIGPRAGLDSISDWLEQIQEKLNAAEAEFHSVEWDESLADAYDIGTDVVRLRQNVIDEFAAKSLDITVDDYDEAAVASVREALKEKVEGTYDQLIKFAKSEEFRELVKDEALVESIGVVVPFLRLARAAKKLHDKAAEIAEPYVSKGSIDELFDLVNTIDETNEFARQQTKLLNAQAAYILDSRVLEENST